MPLNDTAKNYMLDQLGTQIGFFGLHSADPGTTGTNELTGGSPAYARKAATWASAATGSMTDTGADPVFDVASGSTVAWVGLWSSLTVGTFYGAADVTDEVYGAQGTYTLTSFTISIT